MNIVHIVGAWMASFAGGVWSNLWLSSWWADSALNYLFFTLIAAVVADWRIRERERKEREPFEGWNLRTVGYGENDQTLDWEEVRRFRRSRFELWKFAKSVVSGACQVKLTTVDAALDVWLSLDDERRRIVIDFTKIPIGHISRWTREPPAEAVAAGLWKDLQSDAETTL